MTVVSDETGMVRFINLIIAEGIRLDATDIHIGPSRTSSACAAASTASCRGTAAQGVES